MSRTTRRAVTVLVAGLVVTAGTGVAYAGIAGNATGTQSVTSASWAVTPTGTGGIGTSSTLTWANGANALPASSRYFRAYNTGTTTLAMTTWSFTVMRTDNSGNNVPAVRFDVCNNGTWDTATGACSSMSVSTIAQTESDKFTVTATNSTVRPAAPGSFLNVKAVPVGVNNFQQSFYAGVTTSVSGAQVPDRVTNS
jgi:hypothetical protein